jgi:hypothetical protein
MNYHHSKKAGNQAVHPKTMTKGNPMRSLLPHIREWFLSKQEHFIAFAEADSRLEGWFKAELLVLLSRLEQQGRLDDFEREFNVISPQDGRRKQVDFRLRLRGETHLFSLRHWQPITHLQDFPETVYIALWRG